MRLSSEIIEAGSFTTDSNQERHLRCIALFDRTLEILHACQDPGRFRLVVIESPNEQFIRGRQSPTVGGGVGAAFGAVSTAAHVGQRGPLVRGARADVRCPIAGQWSRGWCASVKDDEYKTARVAQVERLYRLSPGALGAKTSARDIADALLLAEWGVRLLERTPSEEFGLFGLIRPWTVVAFDPSLNCTGYAVLHCEWIA